MAHNAPSSPQPGTAISQMRDRLDWQSLNGTADALQGLSLNPPRGHRAERRAYVTGYRETLDAMRAYQEAGR